MKTYILLISSLVLMVLFRAQSSSADTTLVAVAANFTKPMEEISAAFKKSTGHEAVLSFGATGKFVSQIKNGAPFEVLLAADEASVKELAKEGLAVSGSHKTYALGTLALWSATPGLVDDKGEVLLKDTIKHIAVADPSVAPYGVAAIEYLRSRGILEKIQGKFVYGENISQTYLFVSSKNAEIGLISLSQVILNGKIGSGSGAILPKGSYPEIRQDAVLLNPGKANKAAVKLLEFLSSSESVSIIKKYGYDLP